MPIVSSDPQFYQHQPEETYLHTSQPDLTLQGQQQPLHQQSSYITSEGDGEYGIEQGAGYRRGGAHHSPISEEEDDYDVEADVRREAEIAARYRGTSSAVSGQILPEAPTIPATSAQAMASYEPSPPPQQQPGQPPGPDYEGEGYGDWDTLRTAHHHPTRLSDVLEEEEERSSRRTAGE